MQVTIMAKLSDYLILQHLGSGSFGTCSKVCLRSNTSKLFAWKEIDYSQFTESELQMLCREVNLLRTLQHANVVKFDGRIIDSGTSRVFVLMEYCPNGDLSALISNLAGVNRLMPQFLVPEAFVRRVCAQLLSALDYCHSRNVIHRDLKPANVLMDAQWNAKLADFGLSRVLSSVQSLATTFVGTPMYMSPELLGDQEDGFSTPKSDVWALGCVLHELMALKAPFSARTKPELRIQIRTGCHTELPVTFSPTLRRLAAEMLRIELDKRPSAADLLTKSEVKLWSAATVAVSEAKLWPMTNGDGCGCGCGDGNGGVNDRRRAELLQLQKRLADQEAKLSKAEDKLAEREHTVKQAEAEIQRKRDELQSVESRLKELDRSLREKQQLLAVAAGAASATAREDAERKPSRTIAASLSRSRRHTEVGGHQTQLKVEPQQQQKPKQRRHRIALQSIDLSPIVNQEQIQQQQQQKSPQLLDVGAAVVKDAKKLATAKGKYHSPATAQQETEAKQLKQAGTYEPILGVVTRRQKQLLQKCSPVFRLANDAKQ